MSSNSEQIWSRAEIKVETKKSGILQSAHIEWPQSPFADLNGFRPKSTQPHALESSGHSVDIFWMVSRSIICGSIQKQAQFRSTLEV